MDEKMKLCFVVQRYGLEVNGGSELHCRQLAEHMKSPDREIHVLTSKAVDYMTWRNEYEADEEVINGIRVHRFPVIYERNQDVFNEINDRLLFGAKFSANQEKQWIEKQGPVVPGLLEYLEQYGDYFDAFIFFTYLYYPTVYGLHKVADRAILVPTAHDEPCLRMRAYADLFRAPKAIFFNTEEERALVHRKFKNESIPNDLGGVGIEVPDSIDSNRFKNKYGLDDFVVYVGRIDESKNCAELFRFFRKYKERNPSGLKLVLMGKPAMPIPESADIINLGFVSDEDKFDGMSAARMLVLPSFNESLSMVVLEAMSLRTNVLVNAKCPVLKGHCVKSNGALYYEGYFEFEAMVNYYLAHQDESNRMKDNAQRYVRENYQWDVIVERLSKLIHGLAF